MWESAQSQHYEWVEKKVEEQVQIADANSTGFIDQSCKVRTMEVGIENEPQMEDLAT